MSERGSFVTEYIYCKKCLKVAKKILLNKDKYLSSILIPTWLDPIPDEEQAYLPIIAGKIGGSHIGEELETFEFDFIPEIQKLICHPMRIAVLADNGEKIFKFGPISKPDMTTGIFEDNINGGL